ncbi:MAG TPA: hypothetical protein GXX75_23510 [Clostridiales bacterium]|nr:hypothetical protein [Clostridiales bacterium]
MNEFERKCFLILCDRVEALEKKTADLERKVQSQQINRFVPEDSDGKRTEHSEKMPDPYTGQVN